MRKSVKIANKITTTLKPVNGFLILLLKRMKRMCHINGSPIVLNVTRGTFRLLSSLLRGPLGLDSLGASPGTFGLDCNTAVTIVSGGHSACGAEST